MRVLSEPCIDDAYGDVPYGVELTRRNLLSLLAKLDGNPPNSACTIEKDGFFVKAVEDFAHYGGGVDPGPMHPGTERAIVRPR